LQRGKEGIAWVPSRPLHPFLGLGMILRLAPGVVNHTTCGLGFVVVVVSPTRRVSHSKLCFSLMKKENVLKTYQS